MPPQVAPRPITIASRIARPGWRARRSAVAAGPISRAVERMAPIVMAESVTARDSTSRCSSPINRTGTPRTAARSGLSELSSKGR